MSRTAFLPFESTLQKTDAWLDELMEDLGTNDRHRAYQALRLVLHALRDHLTVDEVADLGAQLPMLVRGLYYEGWRPSGKPLRDRSKQSFLSAIAVACRDDPELFPEAAAWAVFKLLERHVSAGEIRDVWHILPHEIRTLWPRDRE
jgi:uncharacterized protein (DUF2267 family)